MSRQEVIHRNVLSTRLLQLGYNVFLPVYDEGIDLIAHRESDDDVRLIQQKSRWGIFRKYIGRNIWLAFPDGGDWYLVPHDAMLDWPEVAGFLATPSWCDGGKYHRVRMSAALRARCRAYII